MTCNRIDDTTGFTGFAGFEIRLFRVLDEFVVTSAVSNYTITGYIDSYRILPPPKNWRWFDMFRITQEIAMARIESDAATKPWRRMIIDSAQRRRFKRKRFVQQLRAT